MLFINPILTAVILVISLCFLLYAVRQIKSGNLLLRYSLTWLFLGILLLIVALCPAPIIQLSHLLGFSVSSNFVFLVACFFLLITSLSHARAISRLTIQIKSVVQQQAIAEKLAQDNHQSPSAVLQHLEKE